jgi:hypothetical protein
MSDSTSNGMATSLFTRHLEELEELQSGASSFEETPTYQEDEVTGEPSMEWRRQLLEEAQTRVKQAKARMLDPSKVYEKGTLLFDPKVGKFGRVKQSVHGYLLVEFVRGGERDYGKGTGRGAMTPVRLVPAKAKKGGAKAKAPKKKGEAPARRAGGEEVNSYIKQNFKSMSNRELARRTGLSEHTIRRKLGEWGLKRDKR